MKIVFKSILKEEMDSFLDFIRLSITDTVGYQRALAELDGFLYAQSLSEKSLTPGRLTVGLKD